MSKSVCRLLTTAKVHKLIIRANLSKKSQIIFTRTAQLPQNQHKTKSARLSKIENRAPVNIAQIMSDYFSGQ